MKEERERQEGGIWEGGGWQTCLQTLIWTVDLLGQLVQSLSVCLLLLLLYEWESGLLPGCFHSDLSGLQGGETRREGETLW